MMEESADNILRESLLPEGSPAVGSGSDGEAKPNTANAGFDEEVGLHLGEGRVPLVESKPYPADATTTTESLELGMAQQNHNALDPLATIDFNEAEGGGGGTQQIGSNTRRPRFLTAIDISFLVIIVLDCWKDDQHRVDELLATYFFVVWLILLILPFGGGCFSGCDCYPGGLHLRDLIGVALATLIFWIRCVLSSSDDDFGYYYDDLPLFFVGHLCWLAFVVRIRRSSIESPWKQRWFVLGCWLFGMLVSVMDAEDFVPFILMLIVAVIPFVGCGLVLCGGSTGGCLGRTIAFLVPCFQSIKRMELDAQEVQEEDDDNNNNNEEESNNNYQANLDRQIFQLGRPMHTTNTYMARGQWAFAVTAGVLALWVLSFWFFHSVPIVNYFTYIPL